MNKPDLIAAVLEELGYTVPDKDCTKVVDAMLKVTIDALLRGESVYYPHLGTFEIGSYKACTKPNPYTGEPATYPARRTLKFKPGKGFKKRLNGERVEKDDENET